MATKVLISGVCGFVGRSLSPVLAERGFVMRGISRSAHLFRPNIDVVDTGEMGPWTDYAGALQGVSKLVHLAGRVHDMKDAAGDQLSEYRRVNVEGTLNLARQAADAGVQRFVFMSSIKVNGEETQRGKPFRAEDAPAPEDAYGISKREAEDGLMALARKTGMEVVIIRPPLIYGPGVKGNFLTMMRWVEKGLPLPLGAVRNNRRALVALDNLIDLTVTCLEHPAAANQVFLAGDGEDLSTAELLERLGRAMDRPARLLPAPVWSLKSGAALLMKQDVARRLCGSLQVDISKARDVLGWTPQISVDEGLRRTVEFYCT